MAIDGTGSVSSARAGRATLARGSPRRVRRDVGARSRDSASLTPSPTIDGIDGLVRGRRDARRRRRQRHERPRLEAALCGRRPTWPASRILDVSNDLDAGRGRLARSRDATRTRRWASALQARLPGRPVVKSLNTMNNQVMADPSLVPGDHVVFLSGDDADAKDSGARRSSLASGGATRPDDRPRRHRHAAAATGDDDVGLDGSQMSRAAWTRRAFNWAINADCADLAPTAWRRYLGVAVRRRVGVLKSSAYSGGPQACTWSPAPHARRVRVRASSSRCCRRCRSRSSTSAASSTRPSKDWDAVEVRWALMYPDAYEVGLPNQGVQILYEILNERDWILAERTYAVFSDMEQVMRDHAIPQFTVDGAPPGRRLRRARASRSRPSSATPTCSPRSTSPASRCTPSTAATTHPIVLAGGHSAFNPEPIADFIDAAVLGDGEEIVLAISDVIREWKDEGRPGGRDEVLMRLAASGGVYVPKFYDVDYLPDGRIKRVAPNRSGVPWRVHKHTLMDLDQWPYPTQAAGAARRDRARALLRRDLPRLHARLPLLPGRHDHPAGARALDHHDRRHGRERHREVGLRGGRAALAVVGRPQRDRRRRQGSRRPLRGHQRLALAAVHPRRRLQHHAGQRVLPQRPAVGSDVRPRGRVGAAAQGDQQDGVRGGPDPDRRRRRTPTAGGR